LCSIAGRNFSTKYANSEGFYSIQLVH